MYRCKKCGGNIKFDIESQLLKCDYCGQSEDPEKFSPDKDVDEHLISDGKYEVTIYTCPQCGAEIINDDTTVATFCDFCGGTAVLDSRISQERCPDKVIPFKQSKEDCKKAYKKLMRRSIFAPSAMKNEENIDRFRGIYMPYWLYDVDLKGPIQYNGTYTHQVGDYLTTEFWEMESKTDILFHDISYDGSSTFADNLSEAITPFDMKDARPFTPAYLSGFYADTNDVDISVYRKETRDLIGEELHRKLQQKADSKGYKVDGESLRKVIKNDNVCGRLALMPVWFLSYRNKDRICYSVVNGQTGKVAADVPIDYGKYLLGSFILAIPLFILFNFFFSFQTVTIVVLAAIYAILCAGLTFHLRRDLKARENFTDDIGMIYRREKTQQELESSTKEEEAEAEKSKKEKKKKQDDSFDVITFLLNLFAVLGGVFMFFGTIIGMLVFHHFVDYWSSAELWLFIILPIFFSTCWVQILTNLRKRRKHKKLTKSPVIKEYEKKEKLSFKESFPIVFKAVLGVLPVIAVLIIQPVSDFYYFIVAVWVIFLNSLSILELIHKYNLLATRKLPQFNVRGGEGNE